MSDIQEKKDTVLKKLTKAQQIKLHTGGNKNEERYNCYR